jgi:Flp pilus assembly protein TadD
MSRLADMLMGMDRGAARPEGVGAIPRLTDVAEGRRKWLWGGLLVIVTGMVLLSVGAVLRSSSRSISAPAPPAAQKSSPAKIQTASSARNSDEPVVALVSEGLRRAESGSLTEAARVLRSALALKPTHAETWNSLGVVLVREGETVRGIDAFREAVRLAPMHAEAHRNLAVALDRQGQAKEAAVHYRVFLGLSAERHPARDDVARRLTEVPDRELRRQTAAGDPTAPRQ